MDDVLSGGKKKGGTDREMETENRVDMDLSLSNCNVVIATLPLPPYCRSTHLLRADIHPRTPCPPR